MNYNDIAYYSKDRNTISIDTSNWIENSLNYRTELVRKFDISIEQLQNDVAHLKDQVAGILAAPQRKENMVSISCFKEI